MVWFVLSFIASYIIGIIGWSIILIIGNYLETYEELREELCSSPAFIPVVNILTAIGLLILAIVVVAVECIYKYCRIEKLWNKIKDKKLPFRE